MIDYNYISQVSNLAIGINTELQDTHYNIMHNPISVSIVQRASAYNKLALFLLFKTLLRFSDLQSLNLKEIINNGRFRVKQHKNHIMVENDFEIHSEGLKHLLFKIVDLKPFLHYESLRSELARITPQSVRNVLITHHSASHLFRHLEASYLVAQCLPQQVIAGRLGHRDLSSQNSYIHTFPHFKLIIHN